MATLFAPCALLPDGWADNVLVEIDKDGWIAGVDTFKQAPDAGEGADILHGPLIPGMPCAHSHAFQRVLAGLAERADGKKKTFWSWRETMYRVLSFIEPEDMAALAAQVYVEMLKAGYTSVAEFHYVHHGLHGVPYEDTAQMSRQVIGAALDAGIAITHLPALYAYGGFGIRPPTEAQKRFLNSVPSLMEIVGDLHREYRTAPQVTLGLAHHSLRAVSPDMLREGTTAVRALLPEAPIHILAAADREEVEGCIAWSGQRPVAWILDNADIDGNWCIVHATNVNEDETRALAASGAIAALCPSTEANMGAGVFPLARYFEEGGAFAVGSGSHIRVDMFGELRALEYAQRLLKRERNVLTRPDIPSSGAMLYEQCLSGGARATGRRTGRIEPGYRADLLVLDSGMACMTDRLRDQIIDTAVFAANESPVRDVMSGGRWAVRDRRHRKEDQILEKFRETIRKIR